MLVTGYAKNFLIPQKLAIEATPDNLNKLKSKNDSVALKKEKEREEAKELEERIKKLTLNIPVKAGENGKIFGGVTTKEISENLNKQYKINVDKKKINIKETIKALGCYSVEVKLYEGISTTLTIAVVKE